MHIYDKKDKYVAKRDAEIQKKKKKWCVDRADMRSPWHLVCHSSVWLVITGNRAALSPVATCIFRH